MRSGGGRGCLRGVEVKVMGGGNAPYSMNFISSCEYGACAIFAKIVGWGGGGNAPYSLNP